MVAKTREDGITKILDVTLPIIMSLQHMHSIHKVEHLIHTQMPINFEIVNYIQYSLTTTCSTPNKAWT